MPSDITPAIVRAAAEANADGIGIQTIAAILGQSEGVIKRVLRAAGYPGRYTGRQMHSNAINRAVALHEPRLRAAMEAADAVGKPSPRYTPLVPEFGIKIHVSSNGVSLPYTPCIHGDRHV